MPEHVQYEDDDLFNPETHREESDVPLKPLWWALILFVVFAVITHIVLYFMYQAMVKAETKRWDPPQTAVARPANADVPQNQPLLQPFPIVPATETTASTAVPYQNTPVTDLQGHARRGRSRAEKLRLGRQATRRRPHPDRSGEGHAGREDERGVPPAGPEPALSGAEGSSPPPPAVAPATTTTGGAH